MAPDVVQDRNHRNRYFTPPYMTAEPEVTVKKLTKGDPEGDLRFIVLATDGCEPLPIPECHSRADHCLPSVWDQISFQDAVALMAAYLDKPDQSKLSRKYLLPELLQQSPESLARHRQTIDEDKGNWVVQDTNAATHLLRNAYSNEVHPLAEMLSFKAPWAREWRDDITCRYVVASNLKGGTDC